MLAVALEDVKTFDEFLERVAPGGSIRLVKFGDYGFTAPIEKAGAIVIQPMIRLVATAFDKQSNKIYRWQETTEATEVAQVERLRKRLQLEGFVVERGEWTAVEVEQLLRQSAA